MSGSINLKPKGILGVNVENAEPLTDVLRLHSTHFSYDRQAISGSAESEIGGSKTAKYAISALILSRPKITLQV